MPPPRPAPSWVSDHRPAAGPAQNPAACISAAENSRWVAEKSAFQKKFLKFSEKFSEKKLQNLAIELQFLQLQNSAGLHCRFLQPAAGNCAPKAAVLQLQFFEFRKIAKLYNIPKIGKFCEFSNSSPQVPNRHLGSKLPIGAWTCKKVLNALFLLQVT